MENCLITGCDHRCISQDTLYGHLLHKHKKREIHRELCSRRVSSRSCGWISEDKQKGVMINHLFRLVGYKTYD